jgi:hypothetical protein
VGSVLLFFAHTNCFHPLATCASRACWFRHVTWPHLRYYAVRRISWPQTCPWPNGWQGTPWCSRKGSLCLTCTSRDWLTFPRAPGVGCSRHTHVSRVAELCIRRHEWGELSAMAAAAPRHHARSLIDGWRTRARPGRQGLNGHRPSCMGVNGFWASPQRLAIHPRSSAGDPLPCNQCKQTRNKYKFKKQQIFKHANTFIKMLHPQIWRQQSHACALDDVPFHQ